MTSDKLLPWQEDDWRQLCGYLKQSRIPQALLISGNNGIGKLVLARNFARSLLCDQIDQNGFFCSQCRYCALVVAGNHPDYLEITPEEDKNSISVNQIRDVITGTALKPQYDRHRVVIIHPADKLTIAAANAFLKCLEEPGERTLFVLVTSKPNKLSATIVSRCQKITAHPPAPAILSEWLNMNHIPDDRAQLAGLLKGAIMTHSQFLDGGTFNCRMECLEDWHGIAAQRSFPAIIAEKWDKLPKSDLINWMLSWVADIIRQKHGSEERVLYNPDIIDYSRKFSSTLDFPPLYGLYDKLLTCRSRIDMQLNFQSMLEEILINWQEINRVNAHG